MCLCMENGKCGSKILFRIGKKIKLSFMMKCTGHIPCPVFFVWVMSRAGHNALV